MERNSTINKTKKKKWNNNNWENQSIKSYCAYI